MNIILLATGWGSMHGGINSFNEDLAVGLATYPCPAAVRSPDVFCIVPVCTDADIAAAERDRVTLRSVYEFEQCDRDFEKIPFEVLVAVKSLPVITKDDIWVGHDLQTGDAAVAAAHATGSRSALILHTSPEQYKALQRSDEYAERKDRRQRDLFRSADYCFAVGPSLRADLCRKLPRDTVVHMLVPGLQDIETRTETDALHAIVFGRLGSEDDIVKQVQLAAAAYGAAVRRMKQSKDMRLAEMDTMLKVFGASDDEQVARLKRTADDAAGGRIAPLLVLPYDRDRTEVREALAQSNLALVPSFHDGFALTGWEAIAAETPLIVSRKTGLWKLLMELSSQSIAAGMVKGVDIDGLRGGPDELHYTEKDLEEVTQAIVEAMTNHEDRIRAATFLKDVLVRKRDGCSWHKTAEEFLVGVSHLEERLAAEYRFEGKWTGFFIEGPPLRPARVLTESVEVWRDGDKLRGWSSYKAEEGPRTEELADLSVKLDVLNGYTEAKSGYTQGSWCQFQVARRCDGRLLDGMVSWSSTVQPSVDWSRYIWVEDRPGNDALLEFARREMEEERTTAEQRFARQEKHPYPGEKPLTMAYAIGGAGLG